MSLTFTVCPCLKHGRFTGDAGQPIETGSREMAKAWLEEARRNGVLDPGDRERIEAAIASSMMVVMDAWVEPALRERIMLWNLAASATNDPDAFALTDFHAYHALVDDVGGDGSAA